MQVDIGAYEKQRIDAIEDAAVAGNGPARVFDPRRALDEGLDQIARRPK